MAAFTAKPYADHDLEVRCTCCGRKHVLESSGFRRYQELGDNRDEGDWFQVEDRSGYPVLYPSFVCAAQDCVNQGSVHLPVGVS